MTLAVDSCSCWQSLGPFKTDGGDYWGFFWPHQQASNRWAFWTPLCSLTSKLWLQLPGHDRLILHNLKGEVNISSKIASFYSVLHLFYLLYFGLGLVNSNALSVNYSLHISLDKKPHWNMKCHLCEFIFLKWVQVCLSAKHKAEPTALKLTMCRWPLFPQYFCISGHWPPGTLLFFPHFHLLGCSP